MIRPIGLLLMVFMVQCKSNDRTKLEKIAEDRIQLMVNHDPDGLSHLFADRARIESVGFPEAKIGPAGVREAYGRYFKSTPDLTYHVTHRVFGENSVVIEYTCEGTLQGLEDGVPAYMKGKKYSLVNCTRMDIKNGLIVYEMTYFDQVSFLRQMGFFEQLK
jgi:steroid delta-isomerase-like uncharacterized protein